MLRNYAKQCVELCYAVQLPAVECFPSLVVFAIALCGGFENVVQFANLRSQEAGDLLMERWGAWRKTAEDLRAVAAQIRDVRAFLRRMFLVAAYIADEPATCRRYWF